MIRSYQDSDYEKLKELYQHPEWYGGIFDEARDARERLTSKITNDPEAILVYQENDELLGTISLIDDGRVAWLYRFVVKDFEPQITEQLYIHALHSLKSRGHTQVLVYSAVNNSYLDKRYKDLGMHMGGTYVSFWAEI